MNVFVNDAASPTLQVGRLEGDAMKGGLHLEGPGVFANMVITPDAVGGLSPEPAKDPLDGDPGLVRNWRLSTFAALPNGKDPIYNEMPGNEMPDCFAEMEDHRHGAERVGKSQPRVWPASSRTESRRSMAEDNHHFRQEANEEGRYWMDARTVGIRQRKTGLPTKTCRTREEARKSPDGRCSLENGAFTLPLEAGDNEVAVAIANNFFGWGLMLRLADPEGIHLVAQ